MRIKYIQNIKKNKGFTTADVITSIVIIMIFVGIITTLFYNFYLTTTARNRNAIATNCLIVVIEKVKTMNYEDVNKDSVDLLIEEFSENKTIPNGYTLTCEVQNYNEIEENINKKDLIKILKVTVQYTLANKTEKIEISTLIVK